MTRVTDVSFGTKNREYFEFKREAIYASVYVGGVGSSVIVPPVTVPPVTVPPAAVTVPEV